AWSSFLAVPKSTIPALGGRFSLDIHSTTTESVGKHPPNQRKRGMHFFPRSLPSLRQVRNGLSPTSLRCRCLRDAPQLNDDSTRLGAGLQAPFLTFLRSYR